VGRHARPRRPPLLGRHRPTLHRRLLRRVTHLHCHPCYYCHAPSHAQSQRCSLAKGTY
jgi:hypothetical protein